MTAWQPSAARRNDSASRRSALDDLDAALEPASRRRFRPPRRPAHGDALGQQPLGQVRRDEAGHAGDENWRLEAGSWKLEVGSWIRHSLIRSIR